MWLDIESIIISVGNTLGKRKLVRLRNRWTDDVRIGQRLIGYKDGRFF
jgi:hypothetical protein